MLAAPPFRLRRFEHHDLPMVVAAAGDPRIPLVSSVPASGDGEAAQRFIEHQRRRLHDGFGYSFVIADAEDEGIGSIGLWLRDVDLGRASVGYWVLPTERRRGAASAALRAVSRWALRDLRIPRVELVVEPFNTASTRTAEAAGFVHEGLLRSYEVIDGARRDVYAYSLLPTDLADGG